MRSLFYTLLCFFFILRLPAQSSIFTQFRSISCPEKIWVIAHPFKAKKAFKITGDVQLKVDSIKHTGIIGIDDSGGRLDAFKHAYWMAKLTLAIGCRRANKLGIAHEKGNKIQFQKHQLEDAALPDSMSSVMDLHNNEQGIKAVSECKNCADEEVQKIIMNSLNNGSLRVLKKDKQGNFLNCEGAILILKEWYGKWNIPKCLVSSNGG